MANIGFAFYHIEKGKGKCYNLGHHIDRTPGKEYTYQFADPTKQSNNKNIIVNDYCKMPLNKAINQAIKDRYKGGKKLRSDAIKYLKHSFTGTNKRMHEIFENKNLRIEWAQACLNFIDEEFEIDNIVRFAIHLDEKTPHIHCITVPITYDGRLSAKDIVGNIKNIKNLQTRYAEKVERFGLKRGVNPQLSHSELIEWHKDVREELKAREEKRDALDAEISNLRAKLSSLTAKKVLTDVFLPKKKDKQINELLEKIAELERTNAKNQEEILKMYKGNENQKELLQSVYNENLKLKETIQNLKL